MNRRADDLMSFALICRKAQSIPTSVLTQTLTALDLPYSMPRRRIRIAGWGRRAGRFAAGALGTVALLGLGWTRYIEIEPTFTITSNSIEGPNAFDDFKRAASLMVDKDTIALMILPKKAQPSVKGGSNPGISPLLSGPVAIPGADSPRIYSLEEKRELLQLNAPAIKAVREGLGRQYLAPPMRTLNAPTSHYADSRALARLLRVESETLAQQARWADATRSALDAIELGTVIQQNESVMGRHTGIACQAIGRDALWPVVDRLSATEATNAADRLQKIVNKRPPLSSTLLEERNVVLANLREQMDQPDWRRTALSVVNQDSPTPAPSWATYIVLLPYSKATIVRNAENHMSRVLEDASRDWEPYVVKMWERGPDPITESVAPVFDSFRFGDLSSITQNILLINVLQLRGYFVQNGHYPSTYAPQIQARLYRDPFAPRRLFGYRGFGNRYVLYSVGPDGTDNRGTAISHDNGQPFSSSHYVQVDSRGDIIAGVNRR